MLLLKLRRTICSRLAGRLAHGPASADDPRRGVRPAIGREALSRDPEVHQARDLHRPQRNLIVQPGRQILHRNAALGIPVFDRPRAAAGGIGELAALPHVVRRQCINAANPPAVANAQTARQCDLRRRKVGPLPQEGNDRRLHVPCPSADLRLFVSPPGAERHHQLHICFVRGNSQVEPRVAALRRQVPRRCRRSQVTNDGQPPGKLQRAGRYSAEPEDPATRRPGPVVDDQGGVDQPGYFGCARGIHDSARPAAGRRAVLHEL